MSDITWIKLYVDIFDDRKIITLLRQEEGQVKLLVWFVLLAYAGKSNLDGKVMYSESQNLTLNHIKSILEYEKPNSNLTLQSAIDYFVANDMLIIDKRNKGLFIIKNWSQRQNAEALEKARENNRIRQQKYYEKKKQQPNANLTQNLTLEKTLEIVEPNAIKNKNKEVEKEEEYKEKNNPSFFATSLKKEKDKTTLDELITLLVDNDYINLSEVEFFTRKFKVFDGIVSWDKMKLLLVRFLQDGKKQGNPDERMERLETLLEREVKNHV